MTNPETLISRTVTAAEAGLHDSHGDVYGVKTKTGPPVDAPSESASSG